MQTPWHIWRLGTVAYQQAWDLQRQLAEAVADGRQPPTVLLLEHPHTITFGRQGHTDNLLWTEEELARRGVEVIWSDRGGDVTYHGPGQLVGYPILPVAAQGQMPDAVGYLRRLESALLTALHSLGVRATRLPGRTGIWTLDGETPGKLAAIGVRLTSRGISQHGFALNVDPDMAYWQSIIGCGLADARAASLAEVLGSDCPSMHSVEQAVLHGLHNEFGHQLVESMPNRLTAGA